MTEDCPNSPSTLAVNASCSINVTFTPTATGTQTGTVTITDNATSSPQSISLSGTGTSSTSPAVSLSPSSLTFGSAAVAFVQDGGATGSGSTTLAVKLPSNVTKNNLLIVGVSSFAGNAFATTPITDTLGATWTQAVLKNPGTTGTPALAALFYAVAPSAGADTVTVHMTGTNNLHLHVYEVSGLLTTAVLDQIGSNFQSSGTAASVVTAGPTTSPNEFVFGYFARDNGSGTWTGGSGYSNGLATPNTGSGTDAFSEDKTVSALGTQTATATSSASDALTSVIATFKAGGGGIAVGTTSPAQNLTLTNTGSGSLSLSSIVASGDFAESDNCGTFVAAAGSCTISVTFSPTATGTRNGSITFTDSASNSPQIYNLTGTGTPASGPVANLSTNALSFGNQTVNTSSAAQTVTLNNIGSTTMSITSITPSSQYSETDNCGTSVIAGGSCTINVSFAPTATGNQPGTLTISDNAPGSPQSVTLSGTGTAAAAPAVSLSPTGLAFGNQTINTTSGAQSITLTNSGNASLSINSISASAPYSQTNTCGASVGAGGQCTISVKFAPTATGSQPGTLTITDNAAGSPHTASLSGTGTNVTAPAVTLSPTGLAFGNQAINTTSAAQSITLTNSGTASLSLTSIVASAPYAQTNTCTSSIAAGGQCTISVTFTPTATGSQPGTITITDNASGSPQTAALSGTGTSSGGTTVSLSPTSLAFSPQQIGTTSSSKSVTLTNTGSSTLNISSIVPSGDFTMTTTCGATLTALAKCTITVKYVPTVAAAETGSITITDNGSGSPQTVPLTGTGMNITVSPTSIAFGNATVGTTTATQPVTLSNLGTVALTITRISTSGQFTQSNNCGTSLAAGASCTINVAFRPTTRGTHSNSLTLSDNAAGSTTKVTLTGTGQ